MLPPRTPDNTLTHLVAKTFAGIGALASDGIMGFCLVYDLFSLYLGQKGDWKMLLGAYTLGAAGIVGYRGLLS